MGYYSAIEVCVFNAIKVWPLRIFQSEFRILCDNTKTSFAFTVLTLH